MIGRRKRKTRILQSLRSRGDTPRWGYSTVDYGTVFKSSAPGRCGFLVKLGRNGRVNVVAGDPRPSGSGGVLKIVAGSGS